MITLVPSAIKMQHTTRVLAWAISNNPPS